MVIKCKILTDFLMRILQEILILIFSQTQKTQDFIIFENSKKLLQFTYYLSYHLLTVIYFVSKKKTPIVFQI